nr:hypothetical protein [Tanacetum cinerariifolium]
MAETMKQYMRKTRADYESRVARPKIENKDNFELKGQFLKELRTNTFSGSDHEDANEHIEKVLEIVDLFHIPNITIDQVILRAFLVSLTGAASRWLRNKPTAEAPGFYQRNNTNPSYQERRQSMEDTLSKFMSESAKRHKENSILIKEIQASTDAAIRNQGASIKTLKFQIGQVSKDKMEYKGNNVVKTLMNVPIFVGTFSVVTDFAVLENMNAYRNEGMGDVIVGEPFLKEVRIKSKRFEGTITLYKDDKSVTY